MCDASGLRRSERFYCSLTHKSTTALRDHCVGHDVTRTSNAFSLLMFSRHDRPQWLRSIRLKTEWSLGVRECSHNIREQPPQSNMNRRNT